jgi:hypothetical protein
MKRNPSSKRRRSSTKSVLRLPDLEHAKAAVLNSLNSADAKRGYCDAIDESSGSVLERNLQEVIFALGIDSGRGLSLGRRPQAWAIALFGTATPRSRAAFEWHPHRKTAAPASS